MKKLFLLVALPLILLCLAKISAQNKSQPPLETVASVDLKRYSGKWFEIAHYPNKFQKKCIGNTTATYNLQPNGTIDVVNECVTKDGTVDNAKGKARVVDESSKAKLKVRFAPNVLSFIPAVWGDYWIVDLDENYLYAVIGDPQREYFWILSRESELNDATYQNILRRAEAKGFNPAKVIKTPQKVAIVKGAVIEKQR